jgi:hypothetical protein
MQKFLGRFKDHKTHYGRHNRHTSAAALAAVVTTSDKDFTAGQGLTAAALTCRRHRCCHFLPVPQLPLFAATTRPPFLLLLLPKKEAAVAAEGTGATVVAAVSSGNDVGSRQRQWQGQATATETEAAAGAHNNQPIDGSDSGNNFCMYPTVYCPPLSPIQGWIAWMTKLHNKLPTIHIFLY